MSSLASYKPGPFKKGQMVAPDWRNHLTFLKSPGYKLFETELIYTPKLSETCLLVATILILTEEKNI